MIDLVPGKTYTYSPELSKDLGTPQSLVVRWELKSSILGGINPINWLKKDYVTLDGKMLITDVDETTYVFTLAKNKIEAGKDVAARLTETFEV